MATQPNPTDTTYTREQWATAVLNGLGNQAPSQDAINFVINWTARENNQVQPGFNLLNTTLPEPGDKIVNSVGVRQYPTFAEGIQATDATLRQANFAALEQELQFNGIGYNPTVDAEMRSWSGGGYGFDSSWTTTPASYLLSQQEPGAPQPGIVNNPGGAIVNAEIGVQNLTQILANLGSAWQVLQSPGTWIAVGLFVAALALLIIGVIVLDTAQK